MLCELNTNHIMFSFSNSQICLGQWEIRRCIFQWFLHRWNASKARRVLLRRLQHKWICAGAVPVIWLYHQSSMEIHWLAEHGQGEGDERFMVCMSGGVTFRSKLQLWDSMHNLQYVDCGQCIGNTRSLLPTWSVCQPAVIHTRSLLPTWSVAACCNPY